MRVRFVSLLLTIACCGFCYAGPSTQPPASSIASAAKRFPAQIQDCQAAIRWLGASSAKYNIDPDHIGAWGGSAGGHLVALLGTSGGKHAFAPIGGNEDQSDRVQAVCDVFGPTDFKTVMRQAAADKTGKNIFMFNTAGDPYSTLIGVHLGADGDNGVVIADRCFNE